MKISEIQVVMYGFRRPQTKTLIKNCGNHRLHDISSIFKLSLASNKVLLCALKVRLTEYDEIEKRIFSPRKRLP